MFMKYIRLLRLEDHYIILGVVISAGLYFHIRNWWLIIWAAATAFISICAFILNEFVDKEDTDLYSWNPIHIKKGERFNLWVVGLLFSFFTVAGLILAYVDGLIWWGIVMYLIGIFYSLKPIRFKGRFGLDVAAQLVTWIVIPFLAVGWKFGDMKDIFPLMIVILFICWAFILPYQLADYIADLKAKLRGTHIVLGMRKSLFLGGFLSMMGTVLFFSLQLYRIIPWALIFVAIAVYVFVRYIEWLRMSSLTKQTVSMQKYVRFVKPIGYLIIPYLLIWMFV